MILADSHAHLDYSDFSDDLPQVLQRAQQVGVGYINTISTRPGEVAKVLHLCDTIPHLYAGIGVHPHYAHDFPLTVDELLRLANHPKVVAIGETGLDYYYNKSGREEQESLFRTHIRAAHAANLPLVIHTRDAEEETRRILAEEDAARCGGVLHCFSGSAELAQWGVDQGYYISFSGILTFKNGEPLRQIAAAVPLHRLLLETDCPYLAPVPMRGKRNEPSYLLHIAKTLAEVRRISLEEIARITTENYCRLFRIGAAGKSRKGILAYPIGNTLYLNISRGCTLHCSFCPKWQAPIVHHYDLTLTGNPTAQEVIEAMGDLSGYNEEVVFCGYGEPTLRLEVLLAVAAEIKRRGKQVRLNTDGLVNLVQRQDVTPRFKGLIDTVSVSLNGQDEAVYNHHCRPGLAGSYGAVIDFLRQVKPHVPVVIASAIEGVDGVDIEACRQVAERLGVRFRVRYLDRVG